MSSGIYATLGAYCPSKTTKTKNLSYGKWLRDEWNSLIITPTGKQVTERSNPVFLRRSKRPTSGSRFL